MILTEWLEPEWRPDMDHPRSVHEVIGALYKALVGMVEVAEDSLSQWEGDPPTIGELETKRRLFAALEALGKARGER